jgi:hypothetical protein
MMGVENFELTECLRVFQLRLSRCIFSMDGIILCFPKGHPFSEDIGKENAMGPRHPVAALNWFQSRIMVLLQSWYRSY